MRCYHLVMALALDRCHLPSCPWGTPGKGAKEPWATGGAHCPAGLGHGQAETGRGGQTTTGCKCSSAGLHRASSPSLSWMPEASPGSSGWVGVEKESGKNSVLSWGHGGRELAPPSPGSRSKEGRQAACGTAEQVGLFRRSGALSWGPGSCRPQWRTPRHSYRVNRQEGLRVTQPRGRGWMGVNSPPQCILGWLPCSLETEQGPSYRRGVGHNNFRKSQGIGLAKKFVQF